MIQCAKTSPTTGPSLFSQMKFPNTELILDIQFSNLWLYFVCKTIELNCTMHRPKSKIITQKRIYPMPIINRKEGTNQESNNQGEAIHDVWIAQPDDNIPIAIENNPFPDLEILDFQDRFFPNFESIVLNESSECYNNSIENDTEILNPQF